MADEARAAGVRVDRAALERALGVTVVETVATTGAGVGGQARALGRARPAASVAVDYGPQIEPLVADLAAGAGAAGVLAPRAVAALLLQADPSAIESLPPALAATAARLRPRLESLPPESMGASVVAGMSVALRRRADAILDAARAEIPAGARLTPRERASRLLMNPWYGVPVLAAVLYFGLWQFVGRFGAGFLVDALSTLFTRTVGAWADSAFAWLVPWTWLRDLFTGDYGIVPLGLRYAIAIIFPVVGTFFLAFALLEDSGYLPRLAMLLDRLFKRIGLNGRAVIPIVLGFGCGTMASVVTRTLETRRERLIATFLLALAVPCSAQMGVMMGLLRPHPGGAALWMGVLAGVFLLSGWLAARLVPGAGPGFYMELPPLRVPRPDHVLVKTLSRMTWYFREVLPLFVLASVILWAARLTGLFDRMVSATAPVARLLGLPDELGRIFLFGFFRRDYGAAGLYDMQRAGYLDGNQITVAAIVLTLFLPCVAQLLVMGRERGARAALAVAGVVSVLAVSIGWAANVFLQSGRFVL
jgi:ferrous iron transport protein B